MKTTLVIQLLLVNFIFISGKVWSQEEMDLGIGTPIWNNEDLCPGCADSFGYKVELYKTLPVVASDLVEDNLYVKLDENNLRKICYDIITDLTTQNLSGRHLIKIDNSTVYRLRDCDPNTDDDSSGTTDGTANGSGSSDGSGSGNGSGNGSGSGGGSGTGDDGSSPPPPPPGSSGDSCGNGFLDLPGEQCDASNGNQSIQNQCTNTQGPKVGFIWRCTSSCTCESQPVQPPPPPPGDAGSPPSIGPGQLFH